MSQTIRISDELYDTLDVARGDKTFNEVLEELAEEAGLFAEQRPNLDELKDDLRSKYGFSTDQINSILNVLRIIYTGHTASIESGKPGYRIPTDAFVDEIDALSRLGLIDDPDDTAVFGGNHKATSIGRDVGSEAIEEHLHKKQPELERLIDDFGTNVLSFVLIFAFGHPYNEIRSHHWTSYKNEYSEEWWEERPELESEYCSIANELVDLGIAVPNSDYSEDVTIDDYRDWITLPPELYDYLVELDSDLSAIMKEHEVMKYVKQYAEDSAQSSKVDRRKSILVRLQLADETRLEEYVNKLYEMGLTSKYSTDKTPFLVSNIDKLMKEIESAAPEL